MIQAVVLAAAAVLAGGEFHCLDVTLDPFQSSIVGIDTVWVVPGGDSWEFRLDSRLVLGDVTCRGNLRRIGDPDGADGNADSRYVIESLPAEGGATHVVIQYGGRFPAQAQDAAEDFSHHYHSGGGAAVITADGVFLGEGCSWFPRGPEPMRRFRITVRTPGGWRTVSEGRLDQRITGTEGVTEVWEGHYPTPGPTLVAGTYVVEERQWRDVSVRTYFYPDESDLVDTYLDAAVGRLALYDSMLGSYPYEKLAIVENFLPTGYAMPSFTLLGQQVLRLPFIPRISLGHEILHNWWGNGVYIPEKGENWCEGLTTYLADYWYEEATGSEAARRYRHQVLIDYAGYVGETDSMSLREFSARTTPASRAVGYGKGSMLFHMLRGILGHQAFIEALRSFYEQYLWKRATWSEVQEVFSKSSGRDLGWFFSQWADRRGAPVLEIVSAQQAADSVRVQLTQHGDVYRLLVPLDIVGTETVTRERVWLNGADSIYTIAAPLGLVEVVADAGFDLFRLLAPSEVPPGLGRPLADTAAVVFVLQEASAAAAEGLVRGSKQPAYFPQPPSESEPSSAIFVGLPDGEWLKHLQSLCPPDVRLHEGGFTVHGHTGSWEGDMLAVAFRSPADPRGVLLAILGRTEVLAAGISKLRHYGKYGYIVMSDGSVVLKGQWEVQASPLHRRVASAERSTRQ